jgi:hypothetical protein
MIRLLKSGGSYASSSDPRLFFGLGKATSVARVEIHWPGGLIQELHNIGVEETLVLLEPESSLKAMP